MEILRQFGANSIHAQARVQIERLKTTGAKEGFNNRTTFLVDDNGNKYAGKTMKEQPSVEEGIIEIAPALDPNKIKKEVLISNELGKIGFPTPPCVFYDEESPRFAIFRWVDGQEVNFNEIREKSLELRLKFASTIGTFVGTFFEIQKGELLNFFLNKIPGRANFSSVRDKHRYRFEKSKSYLASLNILSPEEEVKIDKVFNDNIDLVPESEFKLVHGDIYSGNLFMSSEDHVNGLIDWSDSAEIDDPLIDNVLTARWLAFDGELNNYVDSNSQIVFDKFISAANTKAHTNYDSRLCYQLIPFFDTLWHLKILVTEHHRVSDAGVRFFEANLRKLLANSGY